MWERRIRYVFGCTKYIHSRMLDRQNHALHGDKLMDPTWPKRKRKEKKRGLFLGGGGGFVQGRNRTFFIESRKSNMKKKKKKRPRTIGVPLVVTDRGRWSSVDHLPHGQATDNNT
jgi:hypothetical protein